MKFCETKIIIICVVIDADSMFCSGCIQLHEGMIHLMIESNFQRQITSFLDTSLVSEKSEVLARRPSPALTPGTLHCQSPVCEEQGCLGGTHYDLNAPRDPSVQICCASAVHTMATKVTGTQVAFACSK